MLNPVSDQTLIYNILSIYSNIDIIDYIEWIQIINRKWIK